FEQVPSAPQVENFSLQEKLKLEKEHLGFYVSEHPLKSVQQAARILSPIELSQLAEQKTKKKVSTVVILNSIRKIMTKKGTPMAFIQIEDISGQAEGVVFSDTYERIERLLVEDSHLIIWGKVDRRDDKTQLIVEEAEPIDRVKMVMINLTLEQAINPLMQNNLKGILQEQSGEKTKAKVPVVAIIGTGINRQFVRFGQNYWVQDESSTIESLNHAGFAAYAQPLISHSTRSTGIKTQSKLPEKPSK
ncbi:MAG: OB-fold nucleic acid binding domain-containing protein, partial [Microcystaceae cyanobacterium]